MATRRHKRRKKKSAAPLCFLRLFVANQLSPTAIFEEFHHEISDKQVLSFCNELPVRAAAVVFDAIFASLPKSQGDGHAAVFLHHEVRRGETGFIREFR